LPARRNDDLFDMTMRMAVPPRLDEAFAHVETWVFDLDNTLYPSDSDLWPKIDHRITLYLHHLFGLDGLSSRALQKYYYQRYGTSLKGLMLEHGVDPHDFLAFAHDIDRSTLPRDERLSAAIGALRGRKVIYTNGSKGHAEATARQLGIDHHFDGVFDIVSADYAPKPDPAAYDRFFRAHDIDPAHAAMFEDLEKNLLPARASGMKTVLVTAKAGRVDHREAWEKVANAPAHVDYVTDDLAGFLGSIGQPA
jgi:putative hydrolase of the HAD superfamily